MNRAARLQSAASWLKQFEGENVLRSYCKQYGVDWRCAVTELKRLVVEIDQEYIKQRERTEQATINQRRQRRESRANNGVIEYQSMLDAFLAKDFAALYAMECERDRGD